MPRKIFIGILALLIPPLAFLYISRLGWTFIYFILLMLFGIGDYLLFKNTGYTGIGLLLPIVAIVHSIELSDIPTNQKRPRFYNRWWGILAIPVVLFGAIFLVRSYLYEPFRIPSGSMLPTLTPGDDILASKFGYGTYGTWGVMLQNKTKPPKAPQRGDVFVFLYPPDETVTYAQRIIGLPGDSISLENGALEINGSVVSVKTGPITYAEKPGDTTYTVQYTSPQFVDNHYETTVPEGTYFLLGDNRNDSRDSRAWGFVPESNLVGKVIAKW